MLWRIVIVVLGIQNARFNGMELVQLTVIVAMKSRGEANWMSVNLNTLKDPD